VERNVGVGEFVEGGVEWEPQAVSEGRQVAPVRPLVAVAARDQLVRSWIVQALVGDGLAVVAAGGERPAPRAGVVPDLLVVGCAVAEGVGVIDAYVRRLGHAFPGVRVVVVAPATRAGELMCGALRARVDAVVLISNLARGLTPTVRAVYADQVVFPRCERRRAGVPALSFRERQVLRFAVQGRTNDEIAAELVLATSTIKSHLTSAFAKLCVHSRNEAAALLLSPDEPAGRALVDLFKEPPQPITDGARR
jgi:two-component system, NarL family, response regulator